jgi:hypothetical protein
MQEYPNRPLSALLSQALVASTVEFDNEFERRMSESGGVGARLSLTVWSNWVRFISDNGTSVQQRFDLFEQEGSLVTARNHSWGKKMHTKDAIKFALTVSNAAVMSVIDEMSGSATTFPTPNGGCHPLWVLGHLTLSEVIRSA